MAAALSSLELMTAREVQTHARISKATLYRLLAAGKGPVARKLGRRTMFLATDVVAWVQNLPVVEASHVEA